MTVPEGATPDAEFIYVGDPMCSWCWGFAPVLDEMLAHYAIPIRLIVGGLRPGPSAEILGERMRAMLQHHWEQVAERSGQPFDHRGLDRPGWLYDTELPARALTVVRALATESTLDVLARLQRAFYAEAIDITDPDVYPDLLAGFDIDIDAFMDRLLADESKEAAWNDFTEARRYGVTGFPTLLLRVDDRLAIVTQGYLPWQHMEPAVSAWLRAEVGDEASGTLFCDVGGAC